jgi:AbrB family looped-hinge helix DNA binding protein
MGASEERRVDEKGRITIPRAIRESLQIDPGEEVAVELEGGHIVIRPRISRSELVETIDGCVNENTRAADAESIDPGELKADWTSDLPNSGSDTV